MTNELIEQFSDKIDKWENEKNFFQKLDRILSRKEVKIDKNNYRTSEFGWCDIKDNSIILNFDSISKINKDNYNETLLTLKGLNYHELAHILYTKVNYQVFYEFCIRKNNNSNLNRTLIKNTLNLLEDHYIENNFILKYNSSVKYFILSTSRIIYRMYKNLNDKQEVLNLYLLIYGRKLYIPTSLLIKCKKLLLTYKSKDFVEKIEKCIDNYIVAKNLDEQYQNAYELYNLLVNEFSLQETSSNLSIQNNKSIRISRQIDKELDDKQLKKELKNSDKLDELNSKINEVKDNIKKEEEKEDLNNSIQKNFNDKDIKENLQKELEDKIEQELNEENDNRLNEIKKDIEDELLDDIKTIQASYDGYSDIIKTQPFNPQDKEKILVSKLVKLFNKLKNELESRYIADKKGKFNVRALMRAQHNPTLKVFKRYQPSLLDKTKVGVAILLDSSSSIYDEQFQTEISASWVLSDTINRINNNSMVIEFSNSHKIIKSLFKKQGAWGRHFRGGTSPLSSLKIAFSNLKTLKFKENVNHLFCFIITDGMWQYHNGCNNIIKVMNRFGIETILVNVGSSIKEEHNCKVVIKVESFDEVEEKLVNWLKKTEKDITQKLRNIYNIKTID
mgnify:CR=1 FL=1